MWSCDSEAKRALVLQVANSSDYRDLPPSQIVPKLADKQIYIGCESTIYRILHAEKMIQHHNAVPPYAKIVVVPSILANKLSLKVTR